MFAFLADCYSPFLIALLGFSIWPLKRAEQTQSLIKLGCSLLIVYSLMLLDNTFSVWPYFQLDYSTHSAFAIVFSLQTIHHKKHFRYLLITLLIGYLCLINHLNYHTFSDIISTTVIILPLLFLSDWVCDKRNNP